MILISKPGLFGFILFTLGPAVLGAHADLLPKTPAQETIGAFRGRWSGQPLLFDSSGEEVQQCSVKVEFQPIPKVENKFNLSVAFVCPHATGQIRETGDTLNEDSTITRAGSGNWSLFPARIQLTKSKSCSTWTELGDAVFFLSQDGKRMTIRWNGSCTANSTISLVGILKR